MAVGTYAIRFSFLGLLGNRDLPGWLMRALRFTPVAVFPGLVAPLVLFPEATGGTPDPARICAAVITVLVGIWTKSIIWSIVAGISTLYALLYLLG
jgi:branched-subunit amino acid transport protein